MGQDPKLGALRISVGFSTTEEEIDRALAVFEKIAGRRKSAGEAA
jgi:cysteine desulfurase